MTYGRLDFEGKLGETLLVGAGDGTSTAQAVAKTKFVGLYFTGRLSSSHSLPSSLVDYREERASDYSILSSFPQPPSSTSFYSRVSQRNRGSDTHLRPPPIKIK